MGTDNGIVATGGYADWAKRMGVPSPEYALSEDMLAKLRDSAQPAARLDDALAWRPPEDFPDSEAALVSRIATIDETLEQLRVYFREAVLRIGHLRGPHRPRMGVVDATQGQAGRQQRAERQREDGLQLRLRLETRAKLIAARIRDAEASRARAIEQLRALRERRTDEPSQQNWPRNSRREAIRPDDHHRLDQPRDSLERR